MALEGLRALHRSLPVVCASPGDLGARTEALYGAYLAGAVLAVGRHRSAPQDAATSSAARSASTTATPTRSCSGTRWPTTRRPIPERDAPTSRPRSGTGDAPGALFDLAAAVGAPTSLAAIGMPADGLDEATRLVVAEAAGQRAAAGAGGHPPDARRHVRGAAPGRRPRPSIATDGEPGGAARDRGGLRRGRGAHAGRPDRRRARAACVRTTSARPRCEACSTGSRGSTRPGSTTSTSATATGRGGQPQRGPHGVVAGWAADVGAGGDREPAVRIGPGGRGRRQPGDRHRRRRASASPAGSSR